MSKGGLFERDVSKALTVWLTGKEKPYSYWRMPSSGGLATIHEECRGLSGDIKSLTSQAEFLTEAFSIECKTGYPRTSFWQLFKRIKGFDLREFWRQAVDDSENAGKKPMLVYRKRGKSVILGISEIDSTIFEDMSDELEHQCRLTMRFDFEELPTVSFYDFNDFLRIITPTMMRSFCHE